MNKNLLNFLALAVVLSGCDGLALPGKGLSGADEISKVAQQIDAGQVDAAQKTITDQPLPEIAHMDPSSMEFCTASAIQTRLGRAADTIARKLVQHANQSPLVRYAMAKTDTEAEFEMQDGIFSEAGYCPVNQGELALAYTSARRPIATAADMVVEDLKTKAQATVTGDFDAAVAMAVSDNAKAERERRKATCKAYREKPEGGVADRDPLIARAEAMILADCQRAGF